MKKWIILAAFMACVIPAVPAISAGPWAAVAESIDRELSASLKLYKEGKAEAAEEKAVDAYFGIFEADKANMEIAVRSRISQKEAAEMEKGFSDIRRAIHNKAPVTDVKARTGILMDDIRKAAGELDKM